MIFADHIELKDWQGQCLLVVSDAELHDFLDDFFTDQGVEAQVVVPPDTSGRYQLLFNPKVSRALVYRLLGQLGSEQIARIVCINSGAGEHSGGA